MITFSCQTFHLDYILSYLHCLLFILNALNPWFYPQLLYNRHESKTWRLPNVFIWAAVMNFNIQQLLWARKSICLLDYKGITAKNFGWELRMDSEVNLMSAGWRENRRDRGWRGQRSQITLPAFRRHLNPTSYNTSWKHFIKEYGGWGVGGVSDRCSSVALFWLSRVSIGRALCLLWWSL